MQEYEKGRYSEEKPLYEIVSDQLSNEKLLEIDRNRELSERIFPVDARFDKKLGRIINPRQFIISGKGTDIDKFLVDDVFWLQRPTNDGSLNRVGVKVLKSRKPSATGKRYVLIETLVDTSLIDDLDGREVTIYDGAEAEAQAVGVIHPGGPNTGGGRDHSGQSNCYGVALLVKQIGNPAPGLPVEINQQAFSELATYEQDSALGTATIAVLDSGIWFKGPDVRPTRCGDISWDFVADDTVPEGDPFPKDDHHGLHGTKICSIIKHTAPEVGILPVKVSNKNGMLTLYDALCGLEFARTHGAKVVNASWSFTADGNNRPEQDFPLLLRAVRDLEESGVIVVAAAGNKSQYVRPDGHIAYNGAPKIYPACYSAVQNNVITVTTVTRNSRGKFSVFENYSPKFVNTGALANAPVPDGEFTVPGFIGSYEGSSFATPYVAAKIAKVMSITTGYISRRALLHRLQGFHEEVNLANAICEGGSYITV